MLKKIKKKLKAIVKAFLFKRYYVFGDSHTEVFEYISNKKLMPLKEFLVVGVGGATAIGMRNPNSKTNALAIFKETLDNINIKSHLIFQLGEVDTGFVIWYRAQKYAETVEEQLNNSISAYVKFLEEVLDKGFKKIAIVSAPLPTILDNQDWGEVANLRKEVRASLKERTKLTLEYNNRLKKETQRMGLKFIDTDAHLLNGETGIIDKKFRNKDRNNHHLDIKKYSEVIIKAFHEK